MFDARDKTKADAAIDSDYFTTPRDLYSARQALFELTKLDIKLDEFLRQNPSISTVADLDLVKDSLSKVEIPFEFAKRRMEQHIAAGRGQRNGNQGRSRDVRGWRQERHRQANLARALCPGAIHRDVRWTLSS